MDYNNCYTQVFNSLIFDESLSVNARFVYILFASKKNIPFFINISNMKELILDDYTELHIAKSRLKFFKN